jgi:alpha-L-fucosidase 2
MIIAGEPVLWFDQPAESWNEALPVGNGRLGAMVFGGVESERIQLNEETIWTKGSTLSDIKNGYKSIPQIRMLLFEGKYTEAEKLCQENLLSEKPPRGSNCYQTLGDIHINFKNLESYSHYKRELRLDSAFFRTTFISKNTRHIRTVFSSAADQTIVILAETDKPGQITCEIELSRPGDFDSIRLENNIVTMTGRANGNGVRFVTKAIVLNHGGKISIHDQKLIVENSDKLEIRIVAGSDYRGDIPAELCSSYMIPLMDKSYVQIFNDHVNEYQKYFNRVSLNIPDSKAASLATDKRIAAQKNGTYDPSLTSLYFQFGRYLLISSSRPGSMPANLQGIWNERLRPPWNSDYHININIQMNYWPSEITNLSECHLPFLNFIGELRENGRKTARELYNAEGFVAHFTTDAWHHTTSFGLPRYGMWPMGVAWAATHIWEHYLFTGDKEYLSEYGYPIMREAALFLSDFMVQHPANSKWVTGPSMSPENVFITPEGNKASVCMGPAMDLQITWHLFDACIKASTELNTDASFRNKMKAQINNLMPVQIGNDGLILEWSDTTLKEAEPGHRHMSHLYGLYPSSQYNWNDTPEYMKASEKVLENRLQHGGGHTGWSRAWMINFYARLYDKDKAWKNLRELWAGSTMANMFDNHPPFQIDGNFGGTAAIAELFLQSHSGEVNLLPCLPDELPEGEVTGLMARGGFEVSILWNDKQLIQASIRSKLGKPLLVRYGSKVVEFNTRKGETIVLNSQLNPVK